IVIYTVAQHRDLHSFPTRRSSDLEFILKIEIDGNEFTSLMEEMAGGLTPNDIMQGIDGEGGDIFKEMEISQMDYEMYIDKETYRSEEHTSELQSRFDLVCRLLLEK